MIDAHIADGAALTKFLYWIKSKKNFNLTEIEVEKKKYKATVLKRPLNSKNIFTT